MKVIDEASTRHRPWIRFLPNIDLGHALTMLGFAATIFTTYNSMDKRITILEEQTKQILTVLSTSQGATKESVTELRQDVRIMKDSMNTIQMSVGVMSYKIDQVYQDRSIRSK